MIDLCTRRTSVAALAAAVAMLTSAGVRAQDPAPTAPTTQPARDQVLAGPKADSPETAGRRFSGQPTGHKMAQPGERLLKLLEDLDLSPAQQEKIRQIREDAQKARAAWRQENAKKIQELREKRAKLREEPKERAEGQDQEPKGRRKNDPMSEEAKALRAQMQELYKGALDSQAKVLDQVKEVLTPEQREKLEARLTEIRKQMRDRHEKQGKHREGEARDGERPKKDRRSKDTTEKEKLEL